MERRRQGRETEAAIIVRPGHRRSTLARVAGLNDLAGYGLGRPAAVRIEDTYFDTPDEALRKARLALRLRKVGAGTLVTLKGRAKEGRAGVVRRLEVERRWSAGALKEVLAVARSCGVTVPAPRYRAGSPGRTMSALGLAAIQRRRTLRQTREVRIRNGRVVAELDSDAVTYRFGSVRVKLRELELEAKARGGDAAIAAVGTALLRMLPGRLERWPHSKLATGRALQQLVEAGRCADVVDASGHLTPRGLSLVRARLARGPRQD